jgi:hypothetical protein
MGAVSRSVASGVRPPDISGPLTSVLGAVPRYTSVRSPGLVPIISSFFGITIRMYHDDHPPPHIHAEYQGYEAFVSIDTGDVLEGQLPRRAAAIVREWCLGSSKTGRMPKHSNRSGGSKEPIMTKILRATHLRDSVLELEFSDGSVGAYDVSPLLERDTELTRPLGDPGYFRRFFIDFGALCWPNGLELSPAAIHRRLAESGALRRDPRVA